MAYDYQIAKMITSKLLKVKLKSNTRKDKYFDVLNIPLGIFSDMITKLNYSHTTHVNMGFDETKM